MTTPKTKLPFSIQTSDLIRLSVAVLAGAIAYWQVTQQWSAQNEQAARMAYRDFLKVSMDNPKLSAGFEANGDFTVLDEEQYFWYATLMTETFEEVLAHVPNIDSWIDLVKIQVDMHCGFYVSDNFVPELYSVKLQDTVSEVLEEIDC